MDKIKVSDIGKRNKIELFSLKNIIIAYIILGLYQMGFAIVLQSAKLWALVLLNFIVCFITNFIRTKLSKELLGYYFIISYNCIGSALYTLVTGFDAGSWLYLVDIPLVCIGIEYTLVHEGKKTINTGIFTIVNLFLILVLYDYDRRYGYGIFFEHFSDRVVENCFRINLFIALSLIVYVGYLLKEKAIGYEEYAIEQASVDTLTGLKNRAALYAAIDRENKEVCAGAILDIDNFKRFNDKYGHDTGDDVLKAIATYLQEFESNNEDIFACRWGGEEFVLVGTSPDSFDFLDRELNEYLAKRRKTSFVIRTEGGLVEETITLTVGITEKHGEESLDALVTRADNFLYVGKNTGKDRVVAVR